MEGLVNMKRTIKKVKRFSAGGFSEAQEKWLGGADRTDPAILARMRKAVPDEAKEEPKKAEPTSTETKDEVIDMRSNPKNVISDDTRKKAMESVNKVEPVKTESKPKPVKTAAKKTAAPAAAKTVKAAAAAAKTVDKDETKLASKDKANPKAVADAYKKAATLNEPFESDFPKTKDDGPKIPPSPGRLGFRGDFFSGRPYGATKLKEARERAERQDRESYDMKKGGKVKKLKSGGKVSSASSRGDGCAQRGKTRGKVY